MSRGFFASAVLCLGGAALMLLPLAVPVSFSKGLAGRQSLFPEWLAATFFYTVMTVFTALTGRAALSDLRRRTMPTTRVQRTAILVRLHHRTELATFPADAAGVVRISLREVNGGERARFVGRVSLGGDPSRALGELVHDEGVSVTEIEAKLAGTHDGVLEWVTTEFDTEKPTATPVQAEIEVRLQLLSLIPSRNVL